jgi:prolyl-tRNA synthetase
MGCHGIGVSRIIGAVASLLSDAQGLNWPRAIAPYEAVILTSPKVDESDAAEVYDAIYGEGRYGDVDLVLDDRVAKSLGWKLKDAELIGYPVVVVLGRGWTDRRELEVQCRRLGFKKDVGLGELRQEVLGLLDQL